MNSSEFIILNVDDTEAPRYAKKRTLLNAGFIVEEAQTGFEALRKVEELQPAVVVLDVQLPDISGTEVCEVIKRRWPYIMVLQTSATFTTAADRTRGLDSGADSYLALPIEPHELIAAVRALLRIRTTEDKLRAFNDVLEQRIAERTGQLADTNTKLKAEIAQRQKAELALVQSQKMEAVGQLTGGIAHDFNNLLTAIIGNLDLIRARATERRIIRLAENAFNAAERGAKLTAQLLAFSRTQQLAARPTDVNALISGMGELLNQSLGVSIVLETALCEPLPAAMVDPNQIELAILNLAINSRDAMPDGGKLTIATAPVKESRLIRIDVTDTGSGMPPNVLLRAFDPFFTTKPPGKGTGLGLSQVYGVAKQLGGDVQIVSDVGRGTTVSILLPMASAGATIEPQMETRQFAARNAEKILVIDDDKDVREVVTSFLSEVGYQVRAAETGAEGLKILPDFGPNLLIVDFAMPSLNGAEVAVAARKHDPKLRILFVSGYADSAVVEGAIGPSPILRKPFRPSELAAAVRASLDAN
jgi:DNA-binding response OmpR family regulator